MKNKTDKTNIFALDSGRKNINLPHICPYCSRPAAERANVRIYNNQVSSSTEIFLFGLLWPLFHSIAGTDYIESKKILPQKTCITWFPDGQKDYDKHGKSLKRRH